MNNIRVSHGALDTAQANLKSKADQIESTLSSMDQQLSPLRDGWDGQARLAYDQAKAEWTQAMQNMHMLLAQISGGVGQANSAFQEADRSSAASFGG